MQGLEEKHQCRKKADTNVLRQEGCDEVIKEISKF